MAIEFKCECGAMCSADETKVGTLYHCEACGLDIPVPASPAPAAPAGETAPELGPDGLPAKRISGLADLQKELGGAAAPTDAAPLADTAKRESDRNALLQQLGGGLGGTAEMMAQMKAVREGAGIDPTQRAAAAKSIGQPKKVKAPVRPPTGVARAAHHLGFKRMAWKPSLAIALVCIGFAVYCFIPHAPAPIVDVPNEITDQDRTIKDPQIVKDNLGRFWAVPQGAKYQQSSSGSVFYLNESDFEEQGILAEDWLRQRNKVQSYRQDQAGRQVMYLVFGVSFVLVGGVLAFLSLWMLHDVRLVRRESIPVAEEVKPEPAAPPVTPVIVDETPVALPAPPADEPKKD